MIDIVGKVLLATKTERLPLQTKERRDANVRYIFGSNPDRYLHLHPRRIVLYSLSGKKIAATTTNSDGCLR